MSSTALDLSDLLTDARTNALVAWAVVALVGITAVTNFALGKLLWGAFAVVVAALIVVPPIALRSRRAMIPWEIVLLAAVPVIAHSITVHPLYGQTTTYLSIAALALIVAVELHIFTPVEMSVRFAVLFVVIATLAMAGLWAVARWGSDILLGTTFILDPAVSETDAEHELMLEFTASTIAGLLAGIVFEYYVRRKAHGRERADEVVAR